LKYQKPEITEYGAMKNITLKPISGTDTEPGAKKR
jgi:hypothetical protein